MKYFLPFLIYLLSVAPLFSQNREIGEDVFDSIFYHTYLRTASNDISLALQTADSLYSVSASNIHKVRSLMLISDMHHRMANRDSSIYYASEADKIATRVALIDWQARICGVLSTQYRETGLLKQGERYLEKGLQISEKLEDPDMANRFKGQIFQEKGFYAIAEKNYRDAIGFFNRAETFFRELPNGPNLNFFLAQNEERLGECYRELQLHDSAIHHYFCALDHDTMGTDEETPLRGFIYRGLGQTYLNGHCFREAHQFLNKALTVAENTDYPDLQLEVYKSLYTYYEQVDDIDNSLLYKEKYLKVMGEKVSENQLYTDISLSRMELKLKEIVASKKLIVLVMFFLLLGIGTCSILYRRKQKRKYQRFKQVIEKLREENKDSKNVPEAKIRNKAAYKEKDIMPQKTKRELLKKLNQFEAGLQFTNKNISISVLAGKMQTNPRYLSCIINTYKKKDFNAYINGLRIEYIIRKMLSDPDYQNYKISYLAEECGFSSHSKFTTIFRSITGMVPSTFMETFAIRGQSKKN